MLRSLLHFLLLIEYFNIVVIHVFNLKLKVANNVLNIPLCLSDALGVVLYQLSHDYEHVLLIGLLVEVVELLHLYEALVVVIFIFQFDDGQEIILL